MLKASPKKLDDDKSDAEIKLEFGEFFDGV
jgi:hypothetical protein